MTEEDKRGISDDVAMEVMVELREIQKPNKDLSTKAQEKLETDISRIVYETINNYLESK